MLTKKYIMRVIAAEISSSARYANKVYYHNPSDSPARDLFQYTLCQEKVGLKEISDLPDLSGEKDQTSIIILDATLNYHSDVEDLLRKMKEKISRTTRLVVVCYNPYLRWVYLFANYIGLRKGPPHAPFLRCQTYMI